MHASNALLCRSQGGHPRSTVPLLGLDVTLRAFDDAEGKPPAMSYDLESDPITGHTGTREVAGNPEATRVEQLSPEHGDPLNNGIIQLGIASECDAGAQVRFRFWHSRSVSAEDAPMPPTGRPAEARASGRLVSPAPIEEFQELFLGSHTETKVLTAGSQIPARLNAHSPAGAATALSLLANSGVPIRLFCADEDGGSR